MSLTLRQDKGSPLTHEEMDNNFKYLSRIESNRFIGGFTNSPNTLPSNLGYSHLAIIGDDIYLFGGWNGSGSLNVIYKSNIFNSTSWTNTGATLPGNLHASQLAIIGDDIYLFGGHNGSAYTNIIYKSNISNPTYFEDCRARLNNINRNLIL